MTRCEVRSAEIKRVCAAVALSLTMVSAAAAEDENRVGLVGGHGPSTPCADGRFSSSQPTWDSPAA